MPAIHKAIWLKKRQHIMSIILKFLSDPIAFIEACTALLTAVYIGKLLVTFEKLEQPHSNGRLSCSVDNSLRFLFQVGALISMPKESLRDQKVWERV